MIYTFPSQEINKNMTQRFVINKVLTISLVNRETGEVVYSAPYDKFAVVLSGVDTVSPVNEND